MHYVINQRAKRSTARTRSLATGIASLAVAILALGPTANAVNATLTVTPSNNQGWVFNSDPANATPYEFTEDQASIGEGSLFVEPISSAAAHKFIAAKTLNAPVGDLDSVAYDFMIAGDGTDSDAQQFYLNVYTKLAGSTDFYSCRFDYTPTSGSTTSFTTASFAATDTPTTVADRPTDAFTCPTTLAGMPADSTVSFLALNVGDTSTSDEGLAGYLDNVVLTQAGNVTTYDFEMDPVVLPNKEACKNNGWKASEAPVFKNQGDCVSFFATRGHNLANGRQ
jgi:hypothetical protein